MFGYLVFAVPELELARAGAGLVAGAHERDEASAVQHLDVAHALAAAVLEAQLVMRAYIEEEE